MFSFTCISKHSKKETLDDLFNSRARITVLMLMLEIYFSVFLPKTFLFTIISLLNLPSIIALAMCVFPQTPNLRFQKEIKNLLRVGIAKSIGGVLLVLYIGFKHIKMYNTTNHKNRTLIMESIIYFILSTFVDVLFSFIAILAIKRTRAIIKILKHNKRYYKKDCN